MFKGKAQTRPATPAATNGTAAKSFAVSNGAAAAKATSGVPSIISSDLRIEGDLFSDGDVQVDGEVVGNISSRTLTLGEQSVVNGSISADTVRICGRVEGAVKASTVVMTKTSKVSGDIFHDSLAIEAGAFIDGHCKRMESDASETLRTASSAARKPSNGGGQASAAPEAVGDTVAAK